MDYWHYFVINLSVATLINGAALDSDEKVPIKRLYKEPDNVIIMTVENFDRKLYGQDFAIIVQFYNTYCGHCRAFRLKYKRLAKEIKHWKNILRLAVLDCSVEANMEVCRAFETGYPTFHYFHENFVKDERNLGSKLPNGIADKSLEEIKVLIIRKMQEEQKAGRLAFAPSLQISSYSSYADAIRGMSRKVLYTFLVIENEKSIIGSELALDMNDYNCIKVKRVYNNSDLAYSAALAWSPAVVAVSPSCHVKVIKVARNATTQKFLQCINKFLHSKNYKVPVRKIDEDQSSPEDNIVQPLYIDTVFYNDLEKSIRTSLHTEVARRKFLNGETLQALIDYLNILVTNYPFRNGGNLKVYLAQLRDTLNSRNEWSGDDVYALVKRFEANNAPVYTTDIEFVVCKGSKRYYRGYSCGLWLLFHTLTVNAANQPDTEGPKVLRGMHGYIKHFFGCSGCSRHFQQMSDRRGLFDVQENEAAILWLWVSHNEVNIRLAGDNTEDPVYPKIQFPSAARCPECRSIHGEWNYPAVYHYLKSMYGAVNIKNITRSSNYAETTPSPLFNLDFEMQKPFYNFSYDFNSSH